MFEKLKSNVKNFFVSSASGILTRNAVEDATTNDLLYSYSLSGIAYACLDKIAKNTANIELKLLKATKKKTVDEVLDHEVLDLLYKVNPYTSFRDFIAMTQLCKDLLGNAFWLKIRSKDGTYGSKGKIQQLWMLRPDKVTIVSEGTDYITRYEYLMGSETKKFEPQDVIHFKSCNPLDTKLGQSSVKPVINLIRSQIFSAKWNTNFFYNEARPDAILTVKGRKILDEQEKDEIRKSWFKKFGGYTKSHGLAILTGETDYKVISESHKDMDFVLLDESIRNNVMIGLGVPKPILVPEEGNKTTVEGAIYIFMSQTIDPNQRAIIDVLNEFLINEYDETLYLDYVSQIPEDKENKARIHEVYLKNSAMTINEVRDELGLPPVEGGDQWYKPIMLEPAGSVKNPKKSFELILTEERKQEFKAKKEMELWNKIMRGKKGQKNIDNISKDIAAKIVKCFSKTVKQEKIERAKTLKNYTDEQKHKLFEIFDKSTGNYEKDFQKKMVKLFNGQEERILNKLFKDGEKWLKQGEKAIKSLADDIDKLDWNGEIEIFIDFMLPTYTEIVKASGDQALANIGVGGNFEMNESVRNFLKKKVLKFSNEVNDTTKEKLKKTLSDGLDNGETMVELRDRVKQVFTTRSDSGAMAIARTEVAGTVNGSYLEGFEQSEVVEAKEWYHAGHSGDNDRDWHVDMSGEVVGLREKFSNGLMYPGDPAGGAEEVVNCKCLILSVIKE